MRDYGLQYGGAVLALPAAPAAEICRTGDGDAALVYLYLLMRGGRAEPEQMRGDLRMTEERLEAALRALAGAGAIAPPAQEAPAKPRPPREVSYTSAEMDAALKGNMSFAWLVTETEKRIGRTARKYDLDVLLRIYEELQLPPEVILLLVTRLCDGGRARLSFQRLQTEAQKWADGGIDTVEKAELALQKDTEMHSALGQTKRLLGILDRELSPTERSWLTGFLEAGSSPEIIARAYDVTVTKKGGPNWAYTRAILERWRAKGYRTPEDLERYDRPAAQRPEASGPDRDEAYYRMLRENLGKKGGDENADG